MTDEKPNYAGTTDQERKPATADAVFAFVKEVTERMDRMGISGTIEVSWLFHSSGSISLRGMSKP